mmetsp:Transcript_40171/g.93740  ORF Transcript_40171/g.93740 Transcript_40171/m.93740 type:complete len:200 (-) Transcript_40171:603-1202(-)
MQLALTPSHAKSRPFALPAPDSTRAALLLRPSFPPPHQSSLTRSAIYVPLPSSCPPHSALQPPPPRLALATTRLALPSPHLSSSACSCSRSLSFHLSHCRHPPSSRIPLCALLRTLTLGRSGGGRSCELVQYAIEDVCCSLPRLAAPCMPCEPCLWCFTFFRLAVGASSRAVLCPANAQPMSSQCPASAHRQPSAFIAP